MSQAAHACRLNLMNKIGAPIQRVQRQDLGQPDLVPNSVAVRIIPFVNLVGSAAARENIVEAPVEAADGTTREDGADMRTL
jgi:hypothetical protein